MKIRKFLLTVGIFAIGTVHAADLISPDARKMINKTNLGRQEAIQRGENLVRAGHRLFEAKDYFGARDKYMEAIKLFRSYPSRYFQEKIEFCQKEIAACYYAKANEAVANADKMAIASDFDEAIKICREAVKYCPEQADELEKRIAIYEKRREIVSERSAFTPERLIPGKVSQEYQIQVLLEQARRLANLGDLSAALVKFNEVLLIDPFNADATQGKRALGFRMSKNANQRYNMLHRKTVSEIEWKYVVPIVPEVSGEVSSAVTPEQAKPRNVELQKSPLRIKLDEIQIPEHSYNAVPISALIRTLQEQSRVNDLKSKQGVNLVYIPNAANLDETPEEAKARIDAAQKRQEERKKRLEERRKAAAANANANADDEGAEDVAGEGEEENDEQKVTLQGSRTSLYNVLCSLRDAGNVDFQVEDFAVIITPRDVTLSPMELMTFPVSVSGNVTKEEIKQVLQSKCPNRNVFPIGSDLYYNPRTKRLSITNTAENLRILQEVIEKTYKAKASDDMVQIMIKLIDINQNDLDELAFNWQLAVNSNVARQDADGNFSRKLIMDESNPLLRYYTSAGDRTPGSVEGSLMSWVWQNDKGTRVTASMFALNQADSADVLMSPRITVKNNRMATVKMVEHHNFPDSEWNEIDMPESDNAHFYATAQPTLDDEQELGVNFSIQPKIVGDIITAKIHVPFKTLAGWTEYDTRQFDEDGNVEDGNFYRMPILNTPEIMTEVTVRDGETVVVCGIVSDQTDTINDKIPILGDIPFIGRLFQSKGTKSTKRNLLVLMTCRKVKPDGAPVDPLAREEMRDTYSKGYPRYGSSL